MTAGRSESAFLNVFGHGRGVVRPLEEWRLAPKSRVGALLDWLEGGEVEANWERNMPDPLGDDTYTQAYDNLVRMHMDTIAKRALLSWADAQVIRRVRGVCAASAVRGACRALVLADTLDTNAFGVLCEPINRLRRQSGACELVQGR